VQAVVSRVAAVRERVAACAAAALLGLGTGCGGAEPECGRLPECDIRAQVCQREVRSIAACARGDAPAEVPIRIVDFDAYVASEIGEAAQAEPEERARRELFYAGLARLGLVPQGLTLEDAAERSIAWVGAFYSNAEREIVILDRGAPLDGLSATGLLLHELVHAQQDAAHDFAALHDAQAPGADSQTGLNALIEGEAVVHTDRALTDAFGYDPGEVDWDRLYRDYGARGSRALAQSESPLFDVSSWFVYAFGARYVNQAFARGGSAHIAALYDAPPASARQIALGFSTAEPERGPWTEPDLDAQALPTAPDGFELISSRRLGAYLAHLFATRPVPERASAPLATTASDRLRADVLTVQAGARGELLVSWRLRFAAAEHAERYLDAIIDPVADSAWVDGRDAIVVAATDRSWIEPLREASAWRALADDATATEAESRAAQRVLCQVPRP
jgi:hypothetical protein